MGSSPVAAQPRPRASCSVACPKVRRPRLAHPLPGQLADRLAEEPLAAVLVGHRITTGPHLVVLAVVGAGVPSRPVGVVRRSEVAAKKWDRRRNSQNEKFRQEIRRDQISAMRTGRPGGARIAVWSGLQDRGFPWVGEAGKVDAQVPWAQEEPPNPCKGHDGRCLRVSATSASSTRSSSSAGLDAATLIGRTTMSFSTPRPLRVTVPPTMAQRFHDLGQIFDRPPLPIYLPSIRARRKNPGDPLGRRIRVIQHVVGIRRLHEDFGTGLEVGERLEVGVRDVAPRDPTLTFIKSDVGFGGDGEGRAIEPDFVRIIGRVSDSDHRYTFRFVATGSPDSAPRRRAARTTTTRERPERSSWSVAFAAIIIHLSCWAMRPESNSSHATA